MCGSRERPHAVLLHRYIYVTVNVIVNCVNRSAKLSKATDLVAAVVRTRLSYSMPSIYYDRLHMKLFFKKTKLAVDGVNFTICI
jgi:hypothetical protein